MIIKNTDVSGKGNMNRNLKKKPIGNFLTFFKEASSLLVAKQVKTDELSPDDIIIAVMGPTGSGKSTFINVISGRETADVGHDLKSCTSNVRNVRVSIPEMAFGDLVFVDTPGFDDTHKQDVDILKMIADWLKSTYEKNVLLSGILYFHRISDNRMAGTPLKNLRMFEELCGKNAFQNIILTTTMWDEVDQETGEDRERELKEVYWRTMLKRNSTTSRFLRTRESAFNLIEPLIETATRRSSVLLQKELVDMHKNLPATAAGLELFSAMGQLVSQRENLLRRIRHEMRRSDGDEMILEPLQDEHQNLQNSLEAIVLEMQRLRLPLGKRFFIMTDKFFSSRFESLKSLISKRLSKPAAAPNIESPPSSIAPVSHTKDLIDQSPPSLTSHDSTVPSDDQTTPTPIVLNSSEILLGVSGCNQFPSPYGRPSLRLQETNIESPPSPIAPVSHTEHLSTASASGATGISKDLIDQSPPSSTSHTTPLSIQVANGSNHVLSLGKGPTSGMVHSGSNTAKEKAQDTGSTVPSDKTTPTPRVLNSSEIRILPDVSGGKPTISLRTSEETSVSELRRELPVPTPSLSTVP